MVTTQVCPFNGILPVYLKTYTTAYPFKNGGWQWNGNSMYPMEFGGYTDINHMPQAYFARLIDFQSGYSSITAGDIVGNAYDPGNFPPLVYDSVLSQVKGWPINGTINPVLTSQSLAWDGSTRVSPFNGIFPAGFSLPAGANTQLPVPGCGINSLTADESVYCSSEILLTNSAYLWRKSGAISNALFSTSGLTFPTNGRFSASIPAVRGGRVTDIIQVSDGVGGAVPYHCIDTDWLTRSEYILCNPINPAASTVNFNTFLQDAGNQLWNSHPNGWVQMQAGTVTVNGVTMNGYGIMMAPDFSSYSLLNILPQDGPAINWNSNGAPIPKIDRNGSLWIKQTNSNLNLFNGRIGGNGGLIPNVHQIPLINLPQNPGLYK